MATLSRCADSKKPTSPIALERTVDTMTKSVSRPWNASTELISTTRGGESAGVMSASIAATLLLSSVRCATYGVMIATRHGGTPASRRSCNIWTMTSASPALYFEPARP